MRDSRFGIRDPGFKARISLLASRIPYPVSRIPSRPSRSSRIARNAGSRPVRMRHFAGPDPAMPEEILGQEIHGLFNTATRHRSHA